jgi:hypothetical protein
VCDVNVGTRDQGAPLVPNIAIDNKRKLTLANPIPLHNKSAHVWVMNAMSPQGRS